MTLLDSIGPAIWRASWQAAVLAVVVVLVLRCFGERLSPRWRFLLWGIVVTRLLFVATPSTPWSAFNLVAEGAPPSERATAQPHIDTALPLQPRTADTALVPTEPTATSTRLTGEAPASPGAAAPASPPPTPSRPAGTPAASTSPQLDFALIARILTASWLAGCLLLTIKLLATTRVLRRRLSACRPVTDPALLDILETTRRQMGLSRSPALLVTPECLSPCIAGAWNPRIILPESLITQSSLVRLRHVLAHELAHLVRGDLWTNWLLLAARTLHWFNPVAWWAVREMRAEREAACDELAFAALGDADRAGYAGTIIDLAATLAAPPTLPGLVGLFSPTSRLKRRVERLLEASSAKTVRAPLAAGLLLGIALFGLTDAAQDTPPAPAEDATPQATEPDAGTHTLSGRCVDDADRSPLAGISVRLYRVAGRTSPPEEIARTTTDADGRYAFPGLVPPRMEGHLDRLVYAVVGFADDRPIGISFMHFRDDREVVELRMAREASTLSGRVIDAAGQPVAGATVLPHFAFDRPVPGLNSTTTDADGRFKIDNLGAFKRPSGKPVRRSVAVLHADYPETRAEADSLPADITVILPAGCVVTGKVTDAVTGEPAAAAVVTARRVDKWDNSYVATDAAGRFRIVVPEGRYQFLAEAEDRVAVAITDRECLAGEPVELPDFKLLAGGFISGHVVNTATGQSVSVSDNGDAITLGLFGPSQPAGPVISPKALAAVDEAGRFLIRAAPGENYPYFINTRGERMSWDTREQPPVIVKAGETTVYDMRITPPASSPEKLKAARELIAGLPDDPSERTARILAEFRKLDHTVDETELWCLLMRELVQIGRDAVPRVSAELDRTTDDRTLRRLAFALRAIGDVRAVPALIRAIPRTLLPSSSDFGLIVGDPELTAFMQAHDLDGGRGGTHFGFGRPMREVFGALHALTEQDFADSELFSMHLSQDPRRQVLQRRIFARQARRWQEWWEANGRTFTNDPAYQQVNLKIDDERLPPPPQGPGRAARIEGVIQGAVLSPATHEGRYVNHAYDLDTGYQPGWPAEVARDEAARDPQQLADWAARNGVDLVCLKHRLPDGSGTYVLQALGMNVREISERDLRNLDRIIAAGKLPEGQPVDDILIHYDAESQQFMADANAAFLYTTREGNSGVIEITDRITRTANLAGLAGDPPPGVGFHLGVRFDLKAIISEPTARE